jgi:hypothetical protein
MYSPSRAKSVVLGIATFALVLAPPCGAQEKSRGEGSFSTNTPTRALEGPAYFQVNDQGLLVCLVDPGAAWIYLVFRDEPLPQVPSSLTPTAVVAMFFNPDGYYEAVATASGIVRVIPSDATHFSGEFRLEVTPSIMRPEMKQATGFPMEGWFSAVVGTTEACTQKPPSDGGS